MLKIQTALRLIASVARITQPNRERERVRERERETDETEEKYDLIRIDV
jgi:hypothetical protein